MSRDPGARTAHTALGRGAEFDVVRRLLAVWGSQARAIGDDAAIVDVASGHRLVASTDTSQEDVHFRRAWLTPRQIGFRAATAALSDLAAMAAEPLGMLVALTLPSHVSGDVEELAAGLGEASVRARCPVVGGDLTGGADLSLTITVLGQVRDPVRRSGARPGDALYVTGRLGGPLRALETLLAGQVPSDESAARFARPVARIDEARWLAGHGATSLIDISDGLASEAGHLAAASGMGIIVRLEWIPRLGDSTDLDAARSGEEYELLATAPASLDVAGFEREFGVPLTRVGDVVAEDKGIAHFRRHDQRVDLPRGYDHFSQ